jgi:hypothetical protein
MAKRELKGNAWKIYMDDWKGRGETELPGVQRHDRNRGVGYVCGETMIDVGSRG